MPQNEEHECMMCRKMNSDEPALHLFNDCPVYVQLVLSIATGFSLTLLTSQSAQPKKLF
jgi:hypothetical protein